MSLATFIIIATNYCLDFLGQIIGENVPLRISDMALVWATSAILG